MTLPYVLLSIIFTLLFAASISAQGYIGIPNKDDPCNCPTFTLEQRISHSDYVIKGTVLSSFVNAEGSPFVTYKVKMIDSCKTADPLYSVHDPTSDIFFVKTSRHTPLSCGGVQLTEGKTYVLFFRASSETNHGLIDKCLGMPLVKVGSFDVLKRKFCSPPKLSGFHCDQKGGSSCDLKKKSKCGGKSHVKTCKWKPQPHGKCKWVMKDEYYSQMALPWKGKDPTLTIPTVF